MKTEVTLENKTKLFGTYIGSEVRSNRYSQTAIVRGIDELMVHLTYQPPIEHTSGFVQHSGVWSTEHSYLLLKSISSITDEDAVEVYQLYFDQKTADDWSNDTGSAYFNPKKVKPTKYHIERITSGDDYVTGDFNKVIMVVDYLRSKGYALPWMGLSVDEMVQAGWIKLKNDE